MRLIVNSIGDANCISLFEDFGLASYCLYCCKRRIMRCKNFCHDGSDNTRSGIDLLRTYRAFLSEARKESSCIGKYMELSYRPDYEAIKSKITDIANIFSVCVHAEDEFLMLGDLPDGTIGRCIRSNFPNGGRIYVEYLITAHHGTHWNKACDTIDAEHVISSNGKSRIGGFRHEYCRRIRNSRRKHPIMCRVHNTYCLGDFMG